MFTGAGSALVSAKKEETRMKIKAIVLCVFITMVTELVGYAQDSAVAQYPSRPITFIVPIPPGGSTDIAYRLISKGAEKYLGQPIVVDNKPGAGSTIGVAAVAASKPDGYTIGGMTHSALYVYPILENLPYQPLRDLRFLLQFGDYNMSIYVKADSPFKTLSDLIDNVKQNPKKLTYGAGGTRTLQNIIFMQVLQREKLEMNLIPFRGGPEVQQALLGAHIDVAVGDFNYPLYEAAKIRLLSLLRDTRSEAYPDVHILKDFGYDVPCPLSFVIGGPKGLPDGIARKIENAYTKAMQDPEFIKGMKEDIRMSIVYRNSQEISKYINDYVDFFSKFLKGMKLEE